VREEGVQVEQPREPAWEGRTIVSTEELVADPLLREMVRRLVAELRPERIYLFGSRARGQVHSDSDYDLLLVVRERLGRGREMEQRANAALRGLGVPIDVVIHTSDYFEWMRAAAASLPATVEREGRLVYAA
jgi:predicted nucleotidyltransferase